MRRLNVPTATFAALLMIMPLIWPGPAAAAQRQYEIIIRNGRIIDGTGNPWYRADVAVADGRIAAVGDLSGAAAEHVIDAAGLYVSPGFIDAHSHAGDALEGSELNGARPLLAQGVTTVFVNPDGGGDVDIQGQRTRMLDGGLGVNAAQLVPHGSVRREVMGMADRAPTAAEMEAMKALVRAGMEGGAFGLSTGLFYAPGSYAATEEIIELASVAADYGGVYISHIRDEADYNIGVVAAVDEVIRIAREAGIPGVVTHVKALGPHVWGFSAAIVQRIERARRQGVEVYADQYPYNASATSIDGALVPRWAQVGGEDSLRARLQDPAARARLREDMLKNFERRGGAARLQIRRYEPDPSLEGRTLAEIAEERDVAAVDLALELLEHGGASLVSFNMLDSDIERLMRQPWTMTSSDGELVQMGVGVPHPRSYGAFPHKIRVYALEKHVVTLPHAIRSMTSLPATVFGLERRGEIRPGAIADVVVFDLESIGSDATYQDPHHLARGMVHVLVNGRFAIRDREFTGELHGRVLRRDAGRARVSLETALR